VSAVAVAAGLGFIVLSAPSLLPLLFRPRWGQAEPRSSPPCAPPVSARSASCRIAADREGQSLALPLRPCAPLFYLCCLAVLDCVSAAAVDCRCRFLRGVCGRLAKSRPPGTPGGTCSPLRKCGRDCPLAIARRQLLRTSGWRSGIRSSQVLARSRARLTCSPPKRSVHTHAARHASVCDARQAAATGRGRNEMPPLRDRRRAQLAEGRESTTTWSLTRRAGLRTRDVGTAEQATLACERRDYGIGRTPGRDGFEGQYIASLHRRGRPAGARAITPTRARDARAGHDEPGPRPARARRARRTGHRPPCSTRHGRAGRGRPSRRRQNRAPARRPPRHTACDARTLVNTGQGTLVSTRRPASVACGRAAPPAPCPPRVARGAVARRLPVRRTGCAG
jgi:hypothetical protein